MFRTVENEILCDARIVSHQVLLDLVLDLLDPDRFQFNTVHPFLYEIIYLHRSLHLLGGERFVQHIVDLLNAEMGRRTIPLYYCFNHIKFYVCLYIVHHQFI